ncbi:Uncharacterised protein [Legionella spiritensis]|nr:Uncharacterised protein [Legionella spiritensis]
MNNAPEKFAGRNGEDCRMLDCRERIRLKFCVLD